MNEGKQQALVCDLCKSTDNRVFATKKGLDYVQCAQCGFVFSDVRNFDFAAHNVATMQGMQDTQMGKHTSARYLKAYEARLGEFEPYRENNRFLEVGCSAGGFLRRVAEQGWDAFGVEPEADSANYCRNELGLNVHVGTLDDASYEPGTFDVVYSNAVIEHVAQPSELLAQAHRLLRPGGLLYADTVNLASYTYENLGARWKLFDPLMHLSLFTPKTLREYCERAGFTVNRIETHGVRFYATREDRPRGWRRVVDELRKAPYSAAARRTLKGDNISVYATKPA